MTKLIRIAGAVLLIGVAAFCVFGFLAAAEAPSEIVFFRVLYSVIGLASFGTAGWLAWPRSRHKKLQQK